MLRGLIQSNSPRSRTNRHPTKAVLILLGRLRTSARLLAIAFFIRDVRTRNTVHNAPQGPIHSPPSLRTPLLPGDQQIDAETVKSIFRSTQKLYTDDALGSECVAAVSEHHWASEEFASVSPSMNFVCLGKKKAGRARPGQKQRCALISASAQCQRQCQKATIGLELLLYFRGRRTSTLSTGVSHPTNVHPRPVSIRHVLTPYDSPQGRLSCCSSLARCAQACNGKDSLRTESTVE